MIFVMRFLVNKPMPNEVNNNNDKEMGLNSIFGNKPFFFLIIVLQNSSWQSLTPSSAVADYLSHLPASTLPLSLHHFLKYSAESIKKESQNQLSVSGSSSIHFSAYNSTFSLLMYAYRASIHLKLKI